MCEIVAIDPERTDDASIHQLAATLHEQQGDGLGILSVQVNGDKFEYDAYRNTKPHWTAFNNFLQRTKEDTWRYVLHGRAKTTGDVNRQNTHPLPVDCPRCDAQWVIHNGSVRNHQQNFASLQSAGHTFETTVDSEIIAHKVSELPDSIEDHDDDTYNIRGNLNYLVFTEDGILAKFSRKYYVTDDFIVSCSTRRADADAVTATYSEMDNTYEWFRVTPSDEDDSIVDIQRKERTSTSKYGAGNRSGSGVSSTGQSASSTRSRGRTEHTTAVSMKTYFNDNRDTITEIHEDLVPKLSEITAYKVAPGVIKVVDRETQDNETEFIFREREPKLYYYYAKDEHEQLMEVFDDDGNLIPAEELSGLDALFAEEPAGEVTEAVQDVSQTTLAEVVEVPEGDELPLGPNASAAQIALKEMTAVYGGNPNMAEQEIRRMSAEEIEALARNAVHVPKAN